MWFFVENIWLVVFRLKGPKMRLVKVCQKSTLGIFLIFSMKLQQHQALKLIIVIFLQKILFLNVCVKMGQNNPKWNFSIWKLNVNFQIFLHEAWRTAAWMLKIDSNNFFRRKSCTGIFRPKRDPKFVFRIYNKLMHWVYLILCMKLPQQRLKIG